MIPTNYAEPSKRYETGCAGLAGVAGYEQASPTAHDSRDAPCGVTHQACNIRRMTKPVYDPVWNFRAPRPLIAELDERAYAEDVSRSQWIREAIRSHLEQPAQIPSEP